MSKGFFEAQKLNPVKGDWIELVKKDFNNVGINLNETEISEKKKLNLNTKAQ